MSNSVRNHIMCNTREHMRSHTTKHITRPHTYPQPHEQPRYKTLIRLRVRVQPHEGAHVTHGKSRITTHTHTRYLN